MSEVATSKTAGDADDLRSALSELERLLTGNTEPLLELCQLGDPLYLDFLFQVQLATLVRQGPACVLSPSTLLSTAQEAAALGAVPMSTPSTLRRQLEKLEKRLHDAGAWNKAQPMWWAPLPPRIELEEFWDGLGPEDGSLSLPTSGDLATAFADAGT